MYIVKCSNCQINLDNMRAGRDIVCFGPFNNQLEATEWIDDNCGYSYWEIYSISKKAFGILSAGIKPV